MEQTLKQPEFVCPECRGALAGVDDLRCLACGASWPGQDGFPKLFRERGVRASDRFMRLFYNGLPALHDPLTTHFLPWLQRDGSEALFRNRALADLELGTLEARPDGGPCHVLEVGVGAGANLPFAISHLPPDLDVVYWGVDLSIGMLRQCRRRLPAGRLDVRLCLADAHALPFDDQVFDRVFHVGAVASYGDAALALAEMARVARPGTPIVLVDEQLDRTRDNRLRDLLAFRLLTFYDRDPHCPIEKVPANAVGVRARQLSRFLYCLRFETPQDPLPP